MKNFLHIRDIPLKDLKKIISDAKNRKSKRKKLNTLDQDKDSPLKGKILLQMFEKSSLRTRLSFYLAIKQLGGGSLTLRPEELHLGVGSESAVRCRINSDVKLYFDDSEKLATTSGGGSVTGSLTASSNVTAYSDIRLKKDIKTIDNALDKVSQMRGVTFTKDDKLSSGIIAQELEKIAPELVHDGEYKSIAYGNVVGYLIEAIKELKERLDNGTS